MAAGTGGAPASGGQQDTRVDRLEEGLAGIKTEAGENSIFDANWPTYPLTPATLSTSFGSNADLTFTANPQYGGAIGNSISVTYVDPGGASATLAVTVSGYNITVNLGRAASAINSTAAQVRTAVMANARASALVNVVNKASQNGTGIVSALAKTALSGATAATRATFDDGRAVGVEPARQFAQVDTQWENSGINPWDAETASNTKAWTLSS